MGTAWQLFGLVWGGTVLLAALVIGTEVCTNTQVNVTYRSPLVLECKGRAPVSWRNHALVSSDSEVITTPINNAGEQRSWLAYRNVTNSDSTITCLTGNGPCIIYSINVYTVPSNVRITDSGLPSNTVQLGNSVTLTCSSSGTDPQYKWYHNDTIIPGATSTTYTVTSANFSAAGQYTCEVSNWAGKDSGTYTLHVQALPAITTLRSSATSNKVTLPRTGTTALDIYCHVSKGSKPVNFQWELNGHSVQGSNTSHGDQASEVVGRLHISTLTPFHQGTYTCFTENTVGSYQSSLTVTVVDPPVAWVKVNDSPITNGMVQVLNGTISRLQCLSNGSIPLMASWSTAVESVNTASVGDVDMMLWLTHEDEGTYTCTVNNTQEGLSHQYRLNVLVYDPIHAITSNESLEGNENSSVTMTCAFFKDPEDPDPFPQVNWTGPSYSSVETATEMSYDVYESSITFVAKRGHYGNFSCSVNDVGVGIMYSNISFKVYYVPEAVDSDTIQVTNKRITSATVQWTQAKDKHYIINYYHLRVATCGGSLSPQNCKQLNTFKSIDNTTAYTLENLAPFTVYSLEVAAENSVGIGPYSNPVTVQSDGDLVAILTASGGALVVLLLATALVVILVMVKCTRRRRRRRRRRQKDTRSREKEVDTKDTHYAPLDMGKVVESGPYAALRYTSPSTEWKQDDNSSTREYAVPPDAIAKPVGVSSECVDSGAPKPVANSTTFRSLGEPTNSTIAVGQASSKTSSAGGKKPVLPKKTSRGKKPIPLAVANSANCNVKQDPVTQSTSPTTSSGGMSSVESPVATKASTAVAKQGKTGKKKQPLSLPASAKHQSATVATASGAESPSKLSVAELAKRIEKGN